MDGWRIPYELWLRIAPLIPPPRKRHRFGGGRPRVPDYQVMNGIFFVLRTGCQWKALDATGICSGSTAHDRFQEWRRAGLFERLWALGLEEYDTAKGIDWSWLAMDGTTTKAPLGGKKSGRNPTDRGKQGVKRSLLTEAAGMPLGIAVAGANRHDVTLVEATIASIPIDRPAAEEEDPQGMCMDKAYDADPVRTFLRELGFTPHIRSRGEEAKDISENGIKARRWVVERTHSWLNRVRRLLIRWEKKAENYLAMLHLAFAIICFRSAGLFG